MAATNSPVPRREAPRGSDRIKRRASNPPGLAAAVVCVLLTGLAVTLDRPVADALGLRLSPAWESFAEAVSLAGEGWVLALAGVVVAGAFALGRRRLLARLVLVATCAALLTGGSATVLRSLIGRTRPHAQAPQGVYGVRRDGHWILGRYDYGSFPSGHTATVVGLVAALWLANRRAGLAALPYAVLVSWSRIALGHHHFSDVVAASCVGAFGGPFFAQRLEPVLATFGRWLRPASGPAPAAPRNGETVGLPATPNPIVPVDVDVPASGQPLLSVVIPSFNEQGNLGPLTAAIAQAVEPLGIPWEVVVADDCSQDRSWQVLTELGRAERRIRGLRLARNSGQSAALWAGIKDARGRIVATMDADLQNVPGDLPVLLAALKTCDCVCGTRVANRKHGDSIVRRLASQIANGVRNRITHESVTDSGCGYRVFRRECVQNLKFFRGMHRFLPTLIRMEGFTVAEVPITHQRRLSGLSHYGVWDRLLTSSYDLLAVRWMQRHMFRFQIAERVNFSTPDSNRGIAGEMPSDTSTAGKTSNIPSSPSGTEPSSRPFAALDVS